jgi:hypothetical protein
MDYRKKRIIILSIILGVLAVIFVFGNIFSRATAYAGKSEVILIPNLDPNEVYSYVLFGQETRTKMVRDVEKGWFIQKGDELFPADQKKIQNFEEQLAKASSERFVTDKQENYKDLGIEDPKKGIELYDPDGELIQSIHLGTTETSSPDGNEYVKLGDSEKVYVIKKSLDFYITQDSSYWANLNIFNDFFVSEDVMEVHLVANGISLEEESKDVVLDYSLVLLGEEGRQRWAVKENPETELLMSEAEAVVNSIADLRGGNFVPKKDVQGDVFKNPAATVTVFTNDKREFELTVGSSYKNDSHYAKINSLPYIYTIKNWALAKILKEKSELYKEKDGGNGTQAE